MLKISFPHAHWRNHRVNQEAQHDGNQILPARSQQLHNLGQVFSEIQRRAGVIHENFGQWHPKANWLVFHHWGAKLEQRGQYSRVQSCVYLVYRSKRTHCESIRKYSILWGSINRGHNCRWTIQKDVRDKFHRIRYVRKTGKVGYQNIEKHVKSICPGLPIQKC